MKILALDLATKTGWAMNGDIEKSGVEDFSISRGESPGVRYLKFSAWLREIITFAEPRLIIYEQAHHRGGAATEVLVGLITHLQSICAWHDVEFMPCHTSTIKKFAAGKGNANKDDMIRAYRKQWGKDPIDDNECDARWLLEWGKNTFL